MIMAIILRLCVVLLKSCLLAMFIIFTALQLEMKESRRLYKYFVACFFVLVVALA